MADKPSPLQYFRSALTDLNRQFGLQQFKISMPLLGNFNVDFEKAMQNKDEDIINYFASLYYKNPTIQKKYDFNQVRAIVAEQLNFAVQDLYTKTMSDFVSSYSRNLSGDNILTRTLKTTGAVLEKSQVPILSFLYKKFARATGIETYYDNYIDYLRNIDATPNWMKWVGYALDISAMTATMLPYFKLGQMAGGILKASLLFGGAEIANQLLEWTEPAEAPPLATKEKRLEVLQSFAEGLIYPLQISVGSFAYAFSKNTISNLLVKTGAEAQKLLPKLTAEAGGILPASLVNLLSSYFRDEMWGWVYGIPDDVRTEQDLIIRLYDTALNTFFSVHTAREGRKYYEKMLERIKDGITFELTPLEELYKELNLNEEQIAEIRKTTDNLVSSILSRLNITEINPTLYGLINKGIINEAVPLFKPTVLGLRGKVSNFYDMHIFQNAYNKLGEIITELALRYNFWAVNNPGNPQAEELAKKMVDIINAYTGILTTLGKDLPIILGPPEIEMANIKMGPGIELPAKIISKIRFGTQEIKLNNIVKFFEANDNLKNLYEAHYGGDFNQFLDSFAKSILDASIHQIVFEGDLEASIRRVVDAINLSSKISSIEEGSVNKKIKDKLLDSLDDFWKPSRIFPKPLSDVLDMIYAYKAKTPEDEGVITIEVENVYKLKKMHFRKNPKTSEIIEVTRTAGYLPNLKVYYRTKSGEIKTYDVRLADIFLRYQKEGLLQENVYYAVNEGETADIEKVKEYINEANDYHQKLSELAEQLVKKTGNIENYIYDSLESFKEGLKKNKYYTGAEFSISVLQVGDKKEVFLKRGSISEVYPHPQFNNEFVKLIGEAVKENKPFKFINVHNHPTEVFFSPLDMQFLNHYITLIRKSIEEIPEQKYSIKNLYIEYSLYLPSGTLLTFKFDGSTLYSLNALNSVESTLESLPLRRIFNSEIHRFLEMNLEEYQQYNDEMRKKMGVNLDFASDSVLYLMPLNKPILDYINLISKKLLNREISLGLWVTFEKEAPLLGKIFDRLMGGLLMNMDFEIKEWEKHLDINQFIKSTLNRRFRAGMRLINEVWLRIIYGDNSPEYNKIKDNASTPLEVLDYIFSGLETVKKYNVLEYEKLKEKIKSALEIKKEETLVRFFEEKIKSLAFLNNETIDYIMSFSEKYGINKFKEWEEIRENLLRLRIFWEKAVENRNKITKEIVSKEQKFVEKYLQILWDYLDGKITREEALDNYEKLLGVSLIGAHSSVENWKEDIKLPDITRIYIDYINNLIRDMGLTREEIIKINADKRGEIDKPPVRNQEIPLFKSRKFQYDDIESFHKDLLEISPPLIEILKMVSIDPAILFNILSQKLPPDVPIYPLFEYFRGVLDALRYQFVKVGGENKPLIEALFTDYGKLKELILERLTDGITIPKEMFDLPEDVKITLEELQDSYHRIGKTIMDITPPNKVGDIPPETFYLDGLTWAKGKYAKFIRGLKYIFIDLPRKVELKKISPETYARYLSPQRLERILGDEETRRFFAGHIDIEGHYFTLGNKKVRVKIIPFTDFLRLNYPLYSIPQILPSELRQFVGEKEIKELWREFSKKQTDVIRIVRFFQGLAENYLKNLNRARDLLLAEGEDVLAQMVNKYRSIPKKSMREDIKEKLIETISSKLVETLSRFTPYDVYILLSDLEAIKSTDIKIESLTRDNPKNKISAVEYTKELIYDILRIYNGLIYQIDYARMLSKEETGLKLLKLAFPDAFSDVIDELAPEIAQRLASKLANLQKDLLMHFDNLKVRDIVENTLPQVSANIVHSGGKIGNIYILDFYEHISSGTNISFWKRLLNDLVKFKDYKATPPEDTFKYYAQSIYDVFKLSPTTEEAIETMEYFQRKYLDGIFDIDTMFREEKVPEIWKVVEVLPSLRGKDKREFLEDFFAKTLSTILVKEFIYHPALSGRLGELTDFRVKTDTMEKFTYYWFYRSVESFVRKMGQLIPNFKSEMVLKYIKDGEKVKYNSRDINNFLKVLRAKFIDILNEEKKGTIILDEKVRNGLGYLVNVLNNVVDNEIAIRRIAESYQHKSSYLILRHIFEGIQPASGGVDYSLSIEDYGFLGLHLPEIEKIQNRVENKIGELYARFTQLYNMGLIDERTFASLYDKLNEYSTILLGIRDNLVKARQIEMRINEFHKKIESALTKEFERKVELGMMKPEDWNKILQVISDLKDDFITGNKEEMPRFRFSDDNLFSPAHSLDPVNYKNTLEKKYSRITDRVKNFFFGSKLAKSVISLFEGYYPMLENMLDYQALYLRVVGLMGEKKRRVVELYKNISANKAIGQYGDNPDDVLRIFFRFANLDELRNMEKAFGPEIYGGDKLTQRDLEALIRLFGDVNDPAYQLKDFLMWTADELYKRGFIDQQTLDLYKGRYIHRVYEEFMKQKGKNPEITISQVLSNMKIDLSTVMERGIPLKDKTILKDPVFANVYAALSEVMIIYQHDFIDTLGRMNYKLSLQGNNNWFPLDYFYTTETPQGKKVLNYAQVDDILKDAHRILKELRAQRDQIIARYKEMGLPESNLNIIKNNINAEIKSFLNRLYDMRQWRKKYTKLYEAFVRYKTAKDKDGFIEWLENQRDASKNLIYSPQTIEFFRKYFDDMNYLPNSVDEYGFMRGAIVHKAIYNDIAMYFQITSPQFANETIEFLKGMMASAYRAFKILKVPLNIIGSYLNNTLSNIFQMVAYTGASLTDITKYLYQALEHIRLDTPLWREAVRSGIGEGTMTKQEIYNLQKAFETDLWIREYKAKQERLPQAGIKKLVSDWIVKLKKFSAGMSQLEEQGRVMKLIQYAIEAYGNLDTVFRMAYILYWNDKGVYKVVNEDGSINIDVLSKAVADSYGGTVNYAWVSNEIKKIRDPGSWSGLFFSPFITYKAKIPGVYFRAFARHPFSTLSAILSPFIIKALLLLGIDKDERENIATFMLDTYRDEGIFILPYKIGNKYLFVSSNFNPIGDWINSARMLYTGKFMDVMKSLGVFYGSPVIGLIEGFATGVEPYTQIRIYDEFDTPYEKIGKFLAFSALSFLPSGAMGLGEQVGQALGFHLPTVRENPLAITRIIGFNVYLRSISDLMLMKRSFYDSKLRYYNEKLGGLRRKYIRGEITTEKYLREALEIIKKRNEIMREIVEGFDKPDNSWEYIKKLYVGD